MSDTTNRPPMVFISHSHLDRAHATTLQRVLEKNRAQTYLDQDRIQVADVLPDRIRLGIESCSVFLLLWSMNAAQSVWVNDEWNTAYAQRKKIVPYLLDSTRRPLLLQNLVHVDQKDQQLAHNGLLTAVFGPGVSRVGLFPGTWQVKLTVGGLGSATYTIELRRNGQITGTGGIDGGGMLGQMMAASGMANLLDIQSSISGSWGYDDHTQILTLNMTAHGLGQSFQETIHVQTTGEERGEISGVDFSGRSYALRRMIGVHEIRSALIGLQEAYTRFLSVDLGPETFQDEVEKLLSETEPHNRFLQSANANQPVTSGDSSRGSLAENLRRLGDGGASGRIAAQAIVMGFKKKIDERLANLPS